MVLNDATKFVWMNDMRNFTLEGLKVFKISPATRA